MYTSPSEVLYIYIPRYTTENEVYNEIYAI